MKSIHVRVEDKLFADLANRVEILHLCGRTKINASQIVRIALDYALKHWNEVIE